MKRSLNKRVLALKDQILAETAKGYKPSEVGRVLGIDGRTIKNALKIWSDEEAEAIKAVEEARKAFELAQAALKEVKQNEV
jgi:hypothetical protein